MPHAVVEYSRNLEGSFDAAALMRACHNNLLASEQFAETDIKVRLYACDHALIAGQSATFLHTTVYLLSGRAKDTKKEIADRLLAELVAFNLPTASCSVDVREIDRQIYAKTTG